MRPDRPVFIVGIGVTELRREQDRDDEALVVEATRAALDDAGLEASQVSGLNVQSHHEPGPDVGAVARSLGAGSITWAPTGGLGVPGLATAAKAVVAGRTDVAVVCKVMNTATALNVPVVDPETRRVGGADQFELPYGLGYTVQRAALVQRRWAVSRRVTAEQLGTLCVVQREHAMLNDNAFFRKPLTLSDYLDSRVICDPIRLYDCDYPVNGAYAYVITADPALAAHGRAVAVRGWTHGIGDAMPHIRPEGEPGTRPDVAGLYTDLGITPSHLSALMLYDGFSFLAAQWVERLGVVEAGLVGEYVGDPENIRFDGRTPLNTHGGQLSEGRMHAAGHLLEAVRQLRNEAGPRQAVDPEWVAVTTAFPATGGVALLERLS
jgi:acetyl-CoA acetyltransferase